MQFPGRTGRYPFVHSGLTYVQNLGMVEREQIHSLYMQRHVVPIRHIEGILEKERGLRRSLILMPKK